ncbi:class I SAM-dependent methyltransferase [Arenicella xantha]|uniref:Methyltransferase family protein n=1 Tax=Arenicella xantha TaxID=644221 RepID=A0A395JQP5_9GAMM|nr:class I SAM-dependent methyltransferase [Arenicella xantha]RBP51040.1 methyltransferase family protein [Arenicella xantha]
MDINEEKFNQLFGKVFADIGGAMGLFMAYMGDQAGIYKALDQAGACTAEVLAQKANVDERYLLEWLSANAAAGYIDYNPQTSEFGLSPEQAALFAHEGEPTCLQGFFQSVITQVMESETAIETLKTGEGRAWGDHNPGCFCGTDRFFRPGYQVNLIANWIPAMQGVDEKLQQGGKVADIGCGRGSSSLLMAQHYPNSTVHGYDFHQPSIDAAKAKALAAGISNVEFHTISAKEITDRDFDFVCIFDALHDMGDPVGAAANIKQCMKEDGSFMLVEPLANDSLEENLNLLGAIFYGFSTTVCVPASRAQEVGLGLGAQAGEKKLTDVLTQAGFGNVRRATETATNMVIEARF